MNNLRCPRCGLSHIKKNGHTHYGKQNYACQECGRQFVENAHRVSEPQRQLIRRLLLERISLRGICRVMGVSLSWLLEFMQDCYQSLPEHLNQHIPDHHGDITLGCFEVEADEMWSFVGGKANKQWVWLAIDTVSRQVLAFYVGDRSGDSAYQLWRRIPESYRQQAIFYTDDWDAYGLVIPAAQHQVCAKGSGRTNIIERFNCTLRQRVSRLVRLSLSFSKKLENHIGAIHYFICDYNLQLNQ